MFYLNLKQWKSFRVKNFEKGSEIAYSHLLNAFVLIIKKHSLYRKWSFPLKISWINVTKSAGTADLVTLTEEILNRKLHFLCSDLLAEVYWENNKRPLPLISINYPIKFRYSYWKEVPGFLSAEICRKQRNWYIERVKNLCIPIRITVIYPFTAIWN